MGKLEANKQQKLTSLLNTAFNLFTTQGVTKTSIAEISQKAGIAKGTFYLYFKDKYAIQDCLVAYEANRIFVDELNSNQTLLTFISKNLSWGIFKEALTTKVASDDINFKDVYYEMINAEDISLEEPEIMLFLIVELVSSTCYSAILYKEPADIDTIKPYLFKTVRAIIKEHTIR